MCFTYIVETDIGTAKETNQDSVLVKHGNYSGGEILMAIVCDGMGGLSKGELASAYVIRGFNKWFDEELPYELENLDLHVLAGKWELMLKDMNISLIEYSQRENIVMGTTFSGILFVGENYVITHVGDTRIYHIGRHLKQLTTDQTFVAREISKGTMTMEQAKSDKRRNMLLQCVGASEKLEPEIIIGRQEKGAYMLCSDGFRHEISDGEIMESLSPMNLLNKNIMKSSVKYLIELDKQRKEKDNISVILINKD